jgi:hypothetical protein
MPESSVESHSDSERSIVQRMISFWDLARKTNRLETIPETQLQNFARTIPLDPHLWSDEISAVSSIGASTVESTKSMLPLEFPVPIYQGSYSTSSSNTNSIEESVEENRENIGPVTLDPRIWIGQNGPPLNLLDDYEEIISPTTLTDFPELSDIALWKEMVPKSNSLDPVEDELARFELDQSIVIKRSSNRFLFFKSQEEIALFDAICRWKYAHPMATLREALVFFQDYEFHDVMVKILYCNSQSPWDGIIKYDKTSRPDLALDDLYRKLVGQEDERLTYAAIRGRHIQSLLKRNLFVELEILDLDENDRYLKIIAPFETLAEQAERMKLKVPVSKVFLNSVINEGSEGTTSLNRSLLRKLPYFNRLEKFAKPRISMYFSRSQLENYESGTRSWSPNATWDELVLFFFSSAKRIEICHAIVLHCSVRLHSNTGSESSVEDLLNRKVYESYYAVHDGPLTFRMHEEESYDKVSLFKPGASLADLYSKWRQTLWSGYDPSEDIRNYFGEEHGYYFKWMEFYSRWIKAASIVGLLFFAYGVFQAITTQTDTISRMYLVIDNNAVVFFGLFVNFW